MTCSEFLYILPNHIQCPTVKLLGKIKIASNTSVFSTLLFFFLLNVRPNCSMSPLYYQCMHNNYMPTFSSLQLKLYLGPSDFVSTLVLGFFCLFSVGQLICNFCGLPPHFLGQMDVQKLAKLVHQYRSGYSLRCHLTLIRK